MALRETASYDVERCSYTKTKKQKHEPGRHEPVYTETTKFVVVQKKHK